MNDYYKRVKSIKIDISIMGISILTNKKVKIRYQLKIYFL